jgi:hypothetical protein
VGPARDALRRAVEEHRWATEGLARREAERARLGPLTRLRRDGRDDIARAEAALDAARRRAERAEAAVGETRAALAELEQAVAERIAWDVVHGWRLGRLAELDDALANDWADVALRAVRADEPLAFGVEAWPRSSPAGRTAQPPAARDLDAAKARVEASCCALPDPPTGPTCRGCSTHSCPTAGARRGRAAPPPGAPASRRA